MCLKNVFFKANPCREGQGHCTSDQDCMVNCLLIIKNFYCKNSVFFTESCTSLYTYPESG